MNKWKLNQFTRNHCHGNPTYDRANITTVSSKTGKYNRSNRKIHVSDV